MNLSCSISCLAWAALTLLPLTVLGQANQVEDDETIIAEILAGLDYRVDPNRAQATTVIRDNDPVTTPLPVVSIFADGAGKTMEPCPVCFVPAASFTVSRTGSTNEALRVYLAYDGSATPGQDYRELPRQVTIPAGTNAAHVLMLALDDRLVEGPEIVSATLLALPPVDPGPVFPPFPMAVEPTYLVNTPDTALLVIADDERGAPPARLDIVEPNDGAQFLFDTPILAITVLGVWTEGEIDRPIDFYADDALIGTVQPPAFGRPTIPCLPSSHTFWWTNPPPGRHLLSARTQLSLDLRVATSPVPITIGPFNLGPLARIEATSAIAEEDSTPFDRLNLVGVFTVSRTGPTNQSAGIFVQYSGTATAGEDYPILPWFVTIPAGAVSTEIRVQPFPDGRSEGIETLVATISGCPPVTDPPLGMPCFGPPPDPAHESATVFIRDDGVTRASLTITNPKDRDHFDVGETILIEAVAIDLDGYINRVEFWDGERRIGVSEIVFIRPPDPGTPIHHSFEWRGAPSGPHVLTARAGDDGTRLRSAPVRITVGENQPPHVAITRPASGTEFPPDAAIEIVAETRDPDGYVGKVEFNADGRKIGEARVEFIRPPDPGQPQTFTFVWPRPAPGAHRLTARALDDDGAAGTSAAVEIKVGMSEPLPIVSATAPDPFAVEPRANADLNTATFRIRRFGSTNEALVVAYSLHGAAENGADYEMLSGLATVAAGRRSVDVLVRPLADNLREGIETVLLRLAEPPPPSPEIRVINPYRVGRPRQAVAVISDPGWSHPPGATRCSPLPDGFVHVCFAAEAGHNFRIEASDDLRNWETLFDSISSDGSWHFIDVDMASRPQRFYRLTPEPVAVEE